METNQEIKEIIKEKLIKYNSRVEQLKQFSLSGSLVPSPIPLGLKPGEKYKPPNVRKKGGLFSKKEKKTWKKG